VKLLTIKLHKEKEEVKKNMTLKREKRKENVTRKLLEQVKKIKCLLPHQVSASFWTFGCEHTYLHNMRSAF
jgi:hypothetical protein